MGRTDKVIGLSSRGMTKFTLCWRPAPYLLCSEPGAHQLCAVQHSLFTALGHSHTAVTARDALTVLASPSSQPCSLQMYFRLVALAAGCLKVSQGAKGGGEGGLQVRRDRTGQVNNLFTINCSAGHTVGALWKASVNTTLWSSIWLLLRCLLSRLVSNLWTQTTPPDQLKVQMLTTTSKFGFEFVRSVYCPDFSFW